MINWFRKKLGYCIHDWDKWKEYGTDRYQRFCKKCNERDIITYGHIHKWGKWDQHGYTFQQRQCETCGLYTIREQN